MTYSFRKRLFLVTWRYMGNDLMLMGTFVSSDSLESGVVPRFPKVNTAECPKTFMDVKGGWRSFGVRLYLREPPLKSIMSQSSETASCLQE
jgi:hypothetical protein